MCEVVFNVPEETLVALKIRPAELGEKVRLAAAVKLYELGRLSSGAAATLAGIPRTVFLARLGEWGVETFRQSEDELREDAGRA